MKTGKNTSKQTSLGTLLETYLCARVLVESSEERYRLAVRNLTKFICGTVSTAHRIKLSSLTLDILTKYRAESLLRVTATTYNTEHRHLSALLNFAVRMRWLPSNPLRNVGQAPCNQLSPKALPRHQVGRYIELLEQAYRVGKGGKAVDKFPPQWFWLAVLRTFYFTGMRLRQLVGLNWCDIDFEQGTILLRAETSKTRRQWTIPLPTQQAADLKSLQERTVAIRGPAIAAFQVFCLPIFSPYRYGSDRMCGDNVDAFFQRLHKHVGTSMPRVSAHRLRHSAATVMANTTPNLKVVQEVLGHTSIRTTYGYVQVDLKDMRRAMSNL